MSKHTKPLFSIDWEPWFCYRPYSTWWDEQPTLVEEPTRYLLDLLRRHQIQAIWYLLGYLRDRETDLWMVLNDAGHEQGTHTYYHTYEDWTPKQLASGYFRPPRWHGVRRPLSGGFFFRTMPYWWVKREVLKEGMLYLHPHDLFWPGEEPSGKWTRQIGLAGVRDKLERLCREVEFGNASQLFKSK